MKRFVSKILWFCYWNQVRPQTNSQMRAKLNAMTATKKPYTHEQLMDYQK